MKDSLKEKILTFLKPNEWTYGGTIEDHIRATEGRKASNASRRCRELHEEGKVEARYVIVDGRKVVQYRLMGVYSDRGSGRTVNPLSKGSVGATPTTPTKLTVTGDKWCNMCGHWLTHSENCAKISNKKTTQTQAAQPTLL